MRTFGAKKPLFDHFFSSFSLIFNGFWGQKGDPMSRYGADDSSFKSPKGLDPQNQDFDRFLMKNIKKWPKNHQKQRFWSKIQNFPGYPRGKWKIDIFVLNFAASFFGFFRVLHGKGSIFDFSGQNHQNQGFWSKSVIFIENQWFLS